MTISTGQQILVSSERSRYEVAMQSTNGAKRLLHMNWQRYRHAGRITFIPLFSITLIFCARGSTPVLLCIFRGVLWLWHFLYSVKPPYIPFAVSRAFMAGGASQAGDADSCRAPGLTSGLQGSLNVHRGALLLVPQWQYISSFVFYTFVFG